MLPSAKVPAPGLPGIARGIDPSGTWIYEEAGQAILLELNAEGNGAYPWKDGIFRTFSIADHVWTGTWHQTGNDREGGFEIKMNDDYSAGDGHWWYTRIGNNRDPKRPGGTFLLERQSSSGD